MGYTVNSANFDSIVGKVQYLGKGAGPGKWEANGKWGHYCIGLAASV